MTITIIIKDDNGKQIKSEDFNTQPNENWEKTCYQIGCKVAKEIAESMLQDIEEKIFQKRDKRWKVKGFRQRTCVTRFGDVTVSRRLYKSKEKNRFLLDEHLNWHSYQRATPSLKEALVELSTEFSFRKVSGTMEKLLAGVLTKSTIHSLLTEVSQKAIEREKETYTACFEQGKLTKDGEIKSPILYIESDGLYVHLQREKDKEGKRQEHYELKSGIIYDGWKRLPQTEERFSLTNIYCQSDDSIPFWDGLSLIGDKYWDMGYLKLIILGGDDASWINKGAIELPYCIRQLDGFHLARSCKRGWKNGLDMYSAIRSGRVRKTLGSLEERSGKLAIKERDHVLKCLDRGVDWRKKVDSIVIPEGSRGLGCMESNEDKLFADRMKKKGMSWTIAGAKRMGKAIQLVANGDMRAMCGRRASKCQDRFVEDRLSFDMFFYAPEYEHSVSMPVFGSSHSTRPYGRALRDLTKNDYPLI
jgi:hypothetical protein